jgi:hypothetical protein
MKKILLLMLLFTGFVNGQTINFTDANFKARLLSSSSANTVATGAGNISIAIDADSDGEIQVSEALAVIKLDLRSAFIANVSGIENFTNLSHLYCDTNQISSLNTASLINLVHLSCSNNQITSLNLGNSPSLEYLICNNNSIASLNVNGLANLKEMHCSNNDLPAIDVSTLTGLLILDVDGNPLTVLNVSNVTNLITLRCGATPLTSLNVSALVNLENLEFTNSHIASIDVSSLVNLKSLGCGSNGLTALNVSALVNLESLFVYNNQLTTLDLTGLANLKKLHCSTNLLTALDVNSLTNLTDLAYGNTGLADVDVSNLVNLTSFGYYAGTQLPASLVNFQDLKDLAIVDTQMTVLDVSNLTALTTFIANGNAVLTSINLKNGGQFDEDEIYFVNNPNLTFVCANEVDTATAINGIMTGNGAVVINSYCSFTPGGNYNTITGTATVDADNNGCNISDYHIPFLGLEVSVNGVATNSSVFTNELGVYSLFTDFPGTYQLVPNFENPAYFNVSPITANSIVIDNSTIIQDICITPNGSHPDLEIVIAPITPARPGFDAVYKIVYKNKGNLMLSQLYGINFFYNQNVMDFVAASTPISSSNIGSLSWDYISLMPFESRSIYVTMNINAPTDANPVNIGDVLQLTASALTVGDETTSDNLFQFNQTVVGSYDPNDKQCIEGEFVSPVKIGEYLHYVINFENTGTAAAENVVVKDVIDAAKFDVKTLQILDSSHPVKAKVTGNIAEFVFEGIGLGHGGHGNILLKIRTKDNLTDGSEVTNKADIFFDYNFPIETNIARTIFQSLGLNENHWDHSISVYPNPTHDMLQIKSVNEIKSIDLYDIQGRLLMTRISGLMSETVDLTSKSDGIYLIRIVTEQGIRIEKIVKK